MKKIRFIYSFFLAIAFVIGASIYVYGNFQGIFLPLRNLLTAVLSISGLTVLFYILSTLVISGLKKLEPHLESSLWRLFHYPAVFGLIMFCSWLPCYLAYYPGIFSYDIDVQTAQALGNAPLTRYHPPLHTCFWRLCLFLENTCGFHALVLYSIAQMLILAAALTYILYFLIKKKFNNWIILTALLFFCLTPMIAIVSFIPIKDVMLAAFFAVFTIEVCRFISEKKQYTDNISSHVRLILSAVICCLLRNNFFYALLPSLVVLLLLAHKYWKTILLWGCSIFISYLLINGPIYTALGIGEGNVREMLSVPIQQISYVVFHYEEVMNEDDLSDLNEYLPVEDLAYLYNPRLADPVKYTFDTEAFQKDPMTFFNVWFRLLLKYPDEYVSSFLNLHVPYWYPLADAVDEYSKRHYIETTVYSAELTGYEVIRESKLPSLLEWYEKIASFEKFEENPILARMFSLSTPIWLIITTMLILLSRRKISLISIVLPSLFLWCTFILGPVSNFRYMIPIIVQYPLYLAVILQPGKLE